MLLCQILKQERRNFDEIFITDCTEISQNDNPRAPVTSIRQNNAIPVTEQ